MKKIKCGNPLCNKMFDPSKIRSSKYCCPSCSTTARHVRYGWIKAKDNFMKYRHGTIKLINGMEVRNDAMGKEIADRMFV